MTGAPAVADGKVYVGNTVHVKVHSGDIYCLDASNGNLIWNFTTGDWVSSSPAVAYGNVYVGSNDAYLYAFGGPSIGPTSTSAPPPSATSSPEIPTPTAIPYTTSSPPPTTTPETSNSSILSVIAGVSAAALSVAVALIALMRRTRNK